MHFGEYGFARYFFEWRSRKPGLLMAVIVLMAVVGAFPPGEANHTVKMSNRT